MRITCESRANRVGVRQGEARKQEVDHERRSAWRHFPHKQRNEGMVFDS